MFYIIISEYLIHIEKHGTSTPPILQFNHLGNLHLLDVCGHGLDSSIDTRSSRTGTGAGTALRGRVVVPVIVVPVLAVQKAAFPYNLADWSMRNVCLVCVCMCVCAMTSAYISHVSHDALHSRVRPAVERMFRGYRHRWSSPVKLTTKNEVDESCGTNPGRKNPFGPSSCSTMLVCGTCTLSANFGQNAGI